MIEVTGCRWCATRTGLSVTHLAARTVAAIVGGVTVVVGEAAAFNTLLAYRTFIVGGAIRYTNALGIWVEGRSAGLLAILIGGAVAVIRAGGVFFWLHGLTSAAHTDPIFAIVIVETDAGGFTGIVGISRVGLGAGGSTLTAGTKCNDQNKAG